MAKLTIDGRDFEIPPYKLGALKKAAPFLDSINEAAGSLSSVQGMVDSTADVIEVLAIGLTKIDPDLTAEALLDMIGFDELPAIQQAFVELMRESGLAPKGEATAPAPVAPEAAGASPSA